MKRILMIANDNERWGPARLPEPFSKAEIEVAALCQRDNPLYHTSYVTRCYPMEKLKSWRSFGATLAKVMSEWKPDLVMPCDELVVVMLHYFLKRPRLAARYFNPDQISVLVRSLGRHDTLDAMVLKHETRRLAESLGVRVPRAEVANTLEVARQVATRLGYPVYVKVSFSWAGEGTIKCNDETELSAAYARLICKPAFIKSIARRLLARDWYHNDSVIEVQQAISGEAVMYSVAALDGKVLGGLFGRRMSRLGATGPSTIVNIGSNQQCAVVAAKMISGMGVSGLLAFDFMHCEQTGAMILLECNPRPNQICHLGSKVNADLCQVLADALNDNFSTVRNARGDAAVALFPQSWLQIETTALSSVRTLDIPRNDQRLLDFMLKIGEAQGKNKQLLLQALQYSSRAGGNYTFG